eukprot:6189592-Pleurochrysis_carterae.AAC.3
MLFTGADVKKVSSKCSPAGRFSTAAPGVAGQSLYALGSSTSARMFVNRSQNYSTSTSKACKPD